MRALKKAVRCAVCALAGLLCVAVAAVIVVALGSVVEWLMDNHIGITTVVATVVLVGTLCCLWYLLARMVCDVFKDKGWFE